MNTWSTESKDWASFRSQNRGGGGQAPPCPSPGSTTEFNGCSKCSSCKSSSTTNTTLTRATTLSGGSRGGAQVVCPLVIFRRKWGPKRQKIILETAPPYLRLWVTTPLLTEGLDLPLTLTTAAPDTKARGGHFRNFWVGMCRWDPGTLNLYQS